MKDFKEDKRLMEPLKPDNQQMTYSQSKESRRNNGFKTNKISNPQFDNSGSAKQNDDQSDSQLHRVSYEANEDSKQDIRNQSRGNLSSLSTAEYYKSYSYDPFVFTHYYTQMESHYQQEQPSQSRKIYASQNNDNTSDLENNNQDSLLQNNHSQSDENVDNNQQYEIQDEYSINYSEVIICSQIVDFLLTIFIAFIITYLFGSLILFLAYEVWQG